MNISLGTWVLYTILAVIALNSEFSTACPLCGKSDKTCSCNNELNQILDWIKESKIIRSQGNSEKKFSFSVIEEPTSTSSEASSDVSEVQTSAVGGHPISSTETASSFPHGFPDRADNIQFLPSLFVSFSRDYFFQILSNSLLIAMNISALETVLRMISFGNMPNLTTNESGDWLPIITAAYNSASISSEGTVFFGHLSNGLRIIVIINSNGNALYLSWNLKPCLLAPVLPQPTVEPSPSRGAVSIFSQNSHSVNVEQFNGLENIDGVINLISALTAKSFKFVTVGYFLIKSADIN